MAAVSLIIPAYNEEKRLGPFLRSVMDYAQSHPGAFHEVIVVDDGSRDQTGTIVRRHIRTARFPLHLLQHENNRGKGAAIRMGVMAARGDVTVFIDADGATDITELPNMLRALTEADIAIGNRWMRGAQTERRSPIRGIAGWANRQFMRLCGFGNIDTMCGFKGFRHEVARDLFHHLQEERWLFDTEIMYKALRRRYKIKNFPVRWQSKDGSKLSTRVLLGSAFHILPLLKKLRSQEKGRA